ncbi:hypothetical protein BD779DRAFT_1566125 [Infundibulicybe gibba]|nr:hypothetical protein BD779DRAFT_1566125 [Infundibulicybe gibba]
MVLGKISEQHNCELLIYLPVYDAERMQIDPKCAIPRQEHQRATNFSARFLGFGNLEIESKLIDRSATVLARQLP